MISSSIGISMIAPLNWSQRSRWLNTIVYLKRVVGDADQKSDFLKFQTTITTPRIVLLIYYIHLYEILYTI